MSYPQVAKTLETVYNEGYLLDCSQVTKTIETVYRWGNRTYLKWPRQSRQFSIDGFIFFCSQVPKMAEAAYSRKMDNVLKWQRWSRQLAEKDGCFAHVAKQTEPVTVDGYLLSSNSQYGRGRWSLKLKVVLKWSINDRGNYTGGFFSNGRR